MTKITIENDAHTVTVIDKNGDIDMTVEDMLQLFKQAMCGIGYAEYEYDYYSQGEETDKE